MPSMDPLPFRLRVPGQDELDSKGARSISYRVAGLLHLDGEMITLEWAASRRTQWVSLGGVTDEVDRSPVGSIEVPVSSITQARLRGRWAPRLKLWARQIDVFEGIPGAGPATLTLRIHRRDRDRAKAIAAALEAAGRTRRTGNGFSETGASDPPFP